VTSRLTATIRARGGLYGSIAIYVAAIVVQAWPLLRDLWGQLPSDPGDPVLNAWIVWWNAHAWPLTDHWWNAPAFYPATGTLAFSEHLAGLTLLTTPIHWLTGSPELAYNVAFVLSFPLSAVAAHLLVRRLTGRDDVACVAGAAYGFAPYRVAHLPHIQVLWSFWMPLALLGLHAGRDGRRWGFPLAAACWLMQGLSNGYFLMFFAILVAVWLAWFAFAHPRMLAAAAGWFALAGLMVAPFLLGYQRIHAMYGFVRSVGEIEFYSADVASVVAGHPRLRLYGELWDAGPEGELFPGFALLAIGASGLVYLIASCGIWRVARPGAVGGWVRHVRWPLLTIALIFGSVALASLVSGGFRIDLGVTTIPVFNPFKPFRVFAVAAVAYMLLGMPAARRPRVDGVTAFYLVAACLMLLLSWGPSPRLLHEPLLYKAPYAWLLALPGMTALRVPARFGLLFALCLAVAAGLLLARLVPRSRLGSAALAGLGLFVLAEGWFGPLPVVPSPGSRAPWMDALGGAKAVLELPAGEVGGDVAAELRGAVHRLPVGNGYSGNSPPSYAMLDRAMRNGDFTALEALRPHGPIAVVVQRSGEGGPQIEAALEALPFVHRKGEWPEASLYWLEAGESPAATALGPVVPIVRARASTGEGIDRMTDGDRLTRWTTGAPQAGGEQVIVDADASRDIGAVVLRVGVFAGDVPRLLSVEVSDDGEAWTTVFRGSVAALAVRGAIADPHDVPITVPVGARGRYLRLTQLGRDPEVWWSIAELSVHGR
jgi:hypothetical protein